MSACPDVPTEQDLSRVRLETQPVGTGASVGKVASVKVVVPLLVVRNVKVSLPALPRTVTAQPPLPAGKVKVSLPLPPSTTTSAQRQGMRCRGLRSRRCR